MHCWNEPGFDARFTVASSILDEPNRASAKASDHLAKEPATLAENTTEAKQRLEPILGAKLLPAAEGLRARNNEYEALVGSRHASAQNAALARGGADC